MKKIIIAALIASMLMVLLTACGKETKDYTSETRVLYTDTDTTSDEDSDNTDTDSDKGSDNSKNESKDESSSKGTESKKTVSMKTPSKPVAPQKTESKSTTSKTTEKKSTDTHKTTVPTTASKSETSSSTEFSSKSSSSESTSSANSDTEDKKLTDTDTLSDTESDTDTVIEPSDPFDENEDLVFTYGDNVFRLYDDMEDVIDALGKQPDDIREAGMSQTGVIKEYIYNSLGFSFYAHPDPENEDSYIVNAIHLTSSMVSTEKDVRVGSPEEMIYSVYGESGCEYYSGMYLYYSSDNMYLLQFTVNDGMISDILIALNSNML